MKDKYGIKYKETALFMSKYLHKHLWEKLPPHIFVQKDASFSFTATQGLNRKKRNSDIVWHEGVSQAFLNELLWAWTFSSYLTVSSVKNAVFPLVLLIPCTCVYTLVMFLPWDLNQSNPLFPMFFW